MIHTKHLNLVIGDAPPRFTLPPQFDYVSHQAGEAFQLVKFRDFDSIPAAISGDYYWLFALKRTLCGMGCVPDTLTIAQHDRFNLNVAAGNAFSNDSYFKQVSSASMEALDLAALTQPREGYRWLVAQPYFFDKDQTLLEHYADCHPVGDLLRFAADAVDVCLSPAYATHFLKSTFMFRAPSVGSFEAAPLFKILDILESITLQFCKSGWVRRSGYQERNIGFLLERLHSFLLTVHLEEAGLLNDPNVYGFQTIHSENNILP